MAILANFQGSTLPFDTIKQVSSDGFEYWMARQLQPLLGYSRWQRFEESIERAKLALLNSGGEPDQHFLPAPVKSSGGRPGNDYKLSRHGCYLTAMNGDPRKPEIAAAQNYFAIKTREAELTPSVQDLVNQVLQRAEQLSKIVEQQGQSIANLQSQIGNLLPPDNNFAPPGWDTETWQQLPPQDKRHFRFLARRRRFRPSNQTLALPSSTVEEIRQRQRAEVEQLLDPIPDEEKARLDAAKQEMLARFWAEGGPS